ncbi:predicted protein, partial [Naegleria gruberi]
MLSELLSKKTGDDQNTTSSSSEPSTTKYPYTTSVVADGRRKFHTTYENGVEMVEEFDLQTNQLLLRKRRTVSILGEGTWTIEIGGEVKSFNPIHDLIAPSTVNPIFMRKDTSTLFQWRVRNCFYEPNVYKVNIDHEKQEIVISTTNKKYYKRFSIPDMKESPKTKLNDESLSFKLENNTLIIS